jgi:phage gp37-like protein
MRRFAGLEHRSTGPSMDVARMATLMCTKFEAMGILVHRRIAPLPQRRKAEKIPAYLQYRSWMP